MELRQPGKRVPQCIRPALAGAERAPASVVGVDRGEELKKFLMRSSVDQNSGVDRLPVPARGYRSGVVVSR